MSITATTEDPNKMICSLSVVHESPNMVIIYGDMNRNGKRAEVLGREANSWQLCSDPDNGDNFTATITLNDLPIQDFIQIHAGIGRYSLFIVLVSLMSLIKARDIYRETP